MPPPQYREPLYGTPAPGEFPYTRGVDPAMYRAKLWTVRQRAGFSTPEETNVRFRYLLDRGQNGVDADHPHSIDTEVSVWRTINALAPGLYVMSLVTAERHAVDPAILSGTLRNDILEEYTAQRNAADPNLFTLTRSMKPTRYRASMPSRSHSAPGKSSLMNRASSTRPIRSVAGALSKAKELPPTPGFWVPKPSSVLLSWKIYAFPVVRSCLRCCLHDHGDGSPTTAGPDLLDIEHIEPWRQPGRKAGACKQREQA